MEQTTIVVLIQLKVLPVHLMRRKTGRKIVVGDTIKINVTEQVLNANMTTDAHFVLGGTMGSTTVGKGWEKLGSQHPKLVGHQVVKRKAKKFYNKF